MRYFFVLALGRSGTALIAELLSKSRSARVHHEPSPIDPKLMTLRYSGGFHSALDGMLRARFEDLVTDEGTHPVYGEVNSYLRYEPSWLREKLDATLIHLSRDGRDFVRSAYTRTVYTPWEEHQPIIPKDSDPYSERWADMTRFEKLCWYWCHTNDFLRGEITENVALEGVLESYDYFRERLVDPLSLEIDRSTWQAVVSRPRNSSKQNRRSERLRNLVLRRRRSSIEPLAHWSRWDPPMQRRFWEICGETMTALGYDQ